MKNYDLKFDVNEKNAIAFWLSNEPYGTYYSLYRKFVGSQDGNVDITPEELHKLDTVLAKQRICDVEAIANTLINQLNEMSRKNSQERQSNQNSLEFQD